MTHMLRAALMAAFVFVGAAAHAAPDPAAAKDCRAALSPVGQRMYDATAPHVTASSDLADLLRTHARPLVMNGAITRAQAQAAAPAVGACLRHLKG